MAVWRELIGAIAALALCTLPGCRSWEWGCIDETPFGATGIPWTVGVGSDQDSIEIRILVRLTEEGAASEGADLLMHAARLEFAARTARPGTEQIRALRLMRADGSGVVLGSARYGVTHVAVMDNVLSGCTGAGCSAELIAVVDLRESSESRSINLSGGLEIDLRNCGEDTWGWVIVNGESIDITGPDAGAPVDGGVPADGGDDGSLDAGPPMLRCTRAGAAPAPAEPQCSPEEAACYRACADDACRHGCIDAATPPATCSPCVQDQSFGCSLEVCLDESNLWDCCVWSRCVDLPPALCEPCAAQLAAMQACTNSEELRMYCASRVDACFPPP